MEPSHAWQISARKEFISEKDEKLEQGAERRGRGEDAPYNPLCPPCAVINEPPLAPTGLVPPVDLSPGAHAPPVQAGTAPRSRPGAEGFGAWPGAAQVASQGAAGRCLGVTAGVQPGEPRWQGSGACTIGNNCGKCMVFAGRGWLRNTNPAACARNRC